MRKSQQPTCPIIEDHLATSHSCSDNDEGSHIWRTEFHNDYGIGFEVKLFKLTSAICPFWMRLKGSTVDYQEPLSILEPDGLAVRSQTSYQAFDPAVYKMEMFAFVHIPKNSLKYIRVYI